MHWRIKHIFNFTDERAWGNGFCFGGFHDKLTSGSVYFQEYLKHWIGVFGPGDNFLWTAGLIDPGVSKTHIPVDFKNPHYITTAPDDGATVVSSGGTNKIYKIFPDMHACARSVLAKAIKLFESFLMSLLKFPAASLERHLVDLFAFSQE